MKKILIVDDDKDILMVLRFALEDADYDVTAVENANDALEAVRTAGSEAGGPCAFPVIVIDIMMPGMDGIELLRRIKKESPDTLAIMLTASVSTESAIRALNEGAFAYLVKPVNISEIKLVVKNCYEKYGLAVENRRLLSEIGDAVVVKTKNERELKLFFSWPVLKNDKEKITDFLGKFIWNN